MGYRLVGLPAAGTHIRYVGSPTAGTHIRYPGSGASGASGPPLNARPFVSQAGQSNSVGTDYSIALTTAQPYDGLRQPGRPGTNSATAVALVEAHIDPLFGETQASALANKIHEMDASGRQVIVHNWGVGSTGYAGLAKGSGNYTFGQVGVSNAQAWIAANRPSELFYPCALAWIHGENDEAVAPVSAATYQGFMNQLQADFQTDVRALTGCTQKIPLFLAPHAASANLNPAVAHVETAIGCWLAALNNPDIYYACPQWMFAWINASPHLQGQSVRRMGRYLGRAIKRVVFDGVGWRPIQPSAIAAVNNVVTIDFQGGDETTALVFDITNVARRGLFYGFDYSDAQADIPAITSVALSGARQVQITLSRNAQAPARITAGNYSAIGSNPGGAFILATGVNLRDQDPTPNGDEAAATPDPLPLYNYCVQFDRAIDTVTGSASATAAFANTSSLDGTGAVGTLASARDLATLNGLANCSWSFYIRSNAATWPTTGNALIAKAASGLRMFDFRTASGAAGRLRLFIATTLADAANFTDFDGHVGQTWYHIVVVKTGTTLTYYRNNVPVIGTPTGTVPANLTSSPGDWEILNSINGASGNFNICHISIFTRALALADVAELYNLGVPIDARLLSTGGPAHYWMLSGTWEDTGSAPTRNLLPYGALTFEATHP